MNKIVLNNTEFLLLENPIKIFLIAFGFKNNLLNLIKKRFEIYQYFWITKRRIVFLFYFLINFMPTHITIKQIYLYNLLLIDYSSTYQTYRHLFNLPVNGQRTWGGGRSIKITKSQLFNYKLKKYLKYTNLTNTLFLSEIINMLWHYQWFHEWYISKEYQQYLPWYVVKKKKYVGASLMVMRRIESFYKHPFKGKKKSHRKKKVINKHIITTGFNIGFSLIHNKNLG